MELCNVISQGLLILLGVCFWASTGGLIYLSVELLGVLAPLDGILGDADYLYLVCWAVIGSTFFLFVLGILSFFAACFNKRCLQIVFFTILLLGLGGLITCTTFCLLYREQMKHDIHDTLQHALNKYGLSDGDVNNGVDFLQTNYYCCGIDSYEDWLTTPWGIDHQFSMVPLSCCKKEQLFCVGSIEQLNMINQDGCEIPLYNRVMDYLILMIVVTMATAGIHLVGMTLSCIRLCNIDSNLDGQYGRLAEETQPQISSVRMSRQVQTDESACDGAQQQNQQQQQQQTPVPI